MNNDTHPIAWSFSSLKKFKDCPKMYYETRIAKSVKQTPTEQILYGERAHKAFEVALTTNTPLEGDFKPYAAVAEKLRDVKGVFSAEQKLAITTSFKPATWFGKDVWCRGVLDAVWVDNNKAIITDYKFGKQRKDTGQLKLFALLLFAHHPAVERVNTGFVWMQTGKAEVEKYYRKDVPVLWQDILPDVRRLEYAHRTQTWVPRPSGLCNYCPVQQCNFWRGFNGEGNQSGR